MHSLPDLRAQLPRQIRRRGVFIPDASRGMGIRNVTTKGGGKSRLTGRFLSWQDMLRGIPQLLLDPTGGTCDNILHKVSLLPGEEQERLWPRIRYYDMAGTTHRVIPLPLLYRRGSESFTDVAARYTTITKRLDKNLTNAAMLGWNAFYPLALATGSLLAAMGDQLTEATSLVVERERWQSRVDEAVRQFPELTGQASYLYRDIPDSARRARDWEMKTSSFLTKMRPLEWDERKRAMHGATENALDFGRIVQNHETVLLDFRNVTVPEDRQFLLQWCFGMVYEYIIARKTKGEALPFALVIDELKYLLGDETAVELEQELDELVNVYGRNKDVWLTILHQEQNQLSLKVQQTLMTMGTQIFGSTSDPDAALRIARRFFDWDPELTKKIVPQYSLSQGEIVAMGERTEEYSIQEQEYRNSRRFLSMPELTFYIGISPREGRLPKTLERVTIQDMDKGQFPDEAVSTEIRKRLMYRDGVKRAAILSEIAGRAPGEDSPMVAAGGEATPKTGGYKHVPVDY